MTSEHRFVLADFTCPMPQGRPRLYEAGRSYPMSPALAHAAAKRNLVAHYKSPRWMPPSILVAPQVLTKIEVAEAEAELRALEQHIVEAIAAVLGSGPRP